ncbi:hypothetical protein Glove_52g85 [Diversispora epigaea]|uniref:Uncharacterized protein n=1 Tax=Diversispora epigaea TaxID=1348612 RepID=A0A397JDC1_9GLOM|nr:hypothetical protein Glove_52g85 [Diversispora epigaea]
MPFEIVYKAILEALYHLLKFESFIRESNLYDDLLHKFIFAPLLSLFLSSLPSSSSSSSSYHHHHHHHHHHNHHHNHHHHIIITLLLSSLLLLLSLFQLFENNIIESSILLGSV